MNKSKTKFHNISIRPMVKEDLKTLLDIEKKVYRKNDRQDQSLITHIKQKNGLEYSQVAVGKFKKEDTAETIGYLVAIDDKMDDGRQCVYLDDIALIPQAQRQGIGWKLVATLVEYLHSKAKRRPASRYYSTCT
jgi:ribosomal protein S18 acetylase RimI-like enzyme